MRTLRLFFPFFLLFLSSCGLSPTVFPSPSATSAPTRFPTPTEQPSATPVVAPSPTATLPPVLIISIDGLRPDELPQAQVPNLNGLAARGSYTWQAQTILPSVTLPAHAAMLSGYPPEVHGLTWNDYEPERGLIQIPTIFATAHAAGLRTRMVVGKEKFAHLDLPDSLDSYVFARNGDQDVADEAAGQASAGFDLMFVHFPNNDFFGHSFGWMSSTQIAELARTDDALGRLLAALPADTVLILTADHGGHGLTHGSDSLEDLTIPWIISGPEVRENHELIVPVNIMDTAATALYVLGLSIPDDMVGRPVLEALDK